VVAIVVVAGIIGLVAVLASRRRRRALAAWRSESETALDDAHLSVSLLPASAEDVVDQAHWRSVRERVEQAALALERAATAAPGEEEARATRHTAESLRGLVFALEASRLLRDAPVAPTADQLMEADSALRERRADVDASLAELDRLVRPVAPTS
jgi:hypothetical protein